MHTYMDLFGTSSFKGHNVSEYDDHGRNCNLTEIEMLMMSPSVLSQRSCPVDLMQNCDLPPPLKIVFPGRQPWSSSSTSKCSRGGGDDKFPVPMVEQSTEEQKLNLLKALQLSQTRARSAERKARLAKQDTDRLSTVLLEESLRLLAHQQWVKILEFEISQLQSQKQKLLKVSSNEEDSGGCETAGSCFTWCMTLALCFGIAGVGFAFGCRCLF